MSPQDNQQLRYAGSPDVSRSTARTFDGAMEQLDDPFVLQIGACDGLIADPVRAHIVKHNLAGLLVEPLPDLFDELVAEYRDAGCTRLRFANTAIAGKVGSLTMRRIAPGLHDLIAPWAKGCATATAGNILSPAVARRLRPDLADAIAAATIDVEVCCVPFGPLLREQNVERIDVLVIDVEGMELEVLDGYPAWLPLPQVILAEYINLGKVDQRRLREFGGDQYQVNDIPPDYLLLRKDVYV